MRSNGAKQFRLALREFHLALREIQKKPQVVRRVIAIHISFLVAERSYHRCEAVCDSVVWWNALAENLGFSEVVLARILLRKNLVYGWSRVLILLKQMAVAQAEVRAIVVDWEK